MTPVERKQFEADHPGFAIIAHEEAGKIQAHIRTTGETLKKWGKVLELLHASSPSQAVDRVIKILSTSRAQKLQIDDLQQKLSGSSHLSDN